MTKLSNANPQKKVIMFLAKFGTRAQLGDLVNHQSSYVRWMVAQRGYPEHTERLIFDQSLNVRKAAIKSRRRRADVIC